MKVRATWRVRGLPGVYSESGMDVSLVGSGSSASVGRSSACQVESSPVIGSHLQSVREVEAVPGSHLPAGAAGLVRFITI
jgi:hypothetical protein